jgi:hypothetical protein
MKTDNLSIENIIANGVNTVLAPIRIQRSRKKLFSMPENTIYVGRPSKWGNPFQITALVKREKAVELYKECILNNTMAYYYFDEIYATEMYNHFKYISENLHTLKGKNLACWCQLDKCCHADVLLRFANGC